MFFSKRKYGLKSAYGVMLSLYLACNTPEGSQKTNSDSLINVKPVKTEKYFYQPNPSEDINFDTCQIDINSLNYYLNLVNNISDLEKITENSLPEKTRIRALKHVPYFYDGKKFSVVLSELKKIHEDYKGTIPASIIIDDKRELTRVMTELHKLSYYHYILGKNSSWKRYVMSKGRVLSYPNNACLPTGTDLAICSPYPGSVTAFNKRHDHAYMIIPAKIKSREKYVKSLIVVDGTYNQLFNQEKMQLQNAVFVIPENGFFVSDWSNGANLYPEYVFMIKSAVPQIKGEKMPINEYLKESYKNPVKIKWG